MRENMVVLEKILFVNPYFRIIDKIFLPPLHVKLGLIKQFANALELDEDDGPCFVYTGREMPGLSTEKLKAAIFNVPQIRQLIKNPSFVDSMRKIEQSAWTSFFFLGNHKARDYAELINNMLINFRYLECNMSIKVHYLLGPFPKNR